jgi:hypothetical protein
VVVGRVVVVTDGRVVAVVGMVTTLVVVAAGLVQPATNTIKARRKRRIPALDGTADLEEPGISR